MMVGWVLVCEDCLHKYQLERLNKISANLSDDVKPWDVIKEPKYKKAFEHHIEFGHPDEFYDQVTFRCAECIAVVQIEQARRNREDDPFPVYERTIIDETQQDMEVFESLENQLVENFWFPKSELILTTKPPFSPRRGNSRSYEGDEPLVIVKKGSYKKPLTITIYNITTEDEQNKIVSFVEAYLQQRELNQAKIEFREIEESGKETLKEVLLNC